MYKCHQTACALADKPFLSEEACTCEKILAMLQAAHSGAITLNTRVDWPVC